MTLLKKALCSNIFLIILSMMMPVVSSHAEVGRKTPSHDGTVSAGPYYNPASKSYFELFKSTTGSTWSEIEKMAQENVFKDTQGQLATIKNLETHQFILKNFRAPTAFWIGLQYTCASGTLMWIDGTMVAKTDFTAWSPQWARTHVRCANRGYMPVSYTKNTKYTTPKWQATGPGKGFLYYLVEYPTNGE